MLPATIASRPGREGVLLDRCGHRVGGPVTGKVPVMDYTEQFADRDQHRLYVREYAGQDPPIVLMHGFPDNLHLYDRLVPYLSPPRRVITFDFLGWGAS